MGVSYGASSIELYQDYGGFPLVADAKLRNGRRCSRRIRVRRRADRAAGRLDRRAGRSPSRARTIALEGAGSNLATPAGFEPATFSLEGSGPTLCLWERWRQPRATSDT